MVNNINSICFVLKNKNEKEYKIVPNDETSHLVINDTFVKTLCDDCGIDELKYLSINLGVMNLAIIIKDYSLTDIISFGEFYDIDSHISIFQSVGTNIHIVGQNIKHMQLDCKEVLIAECNIEKLEIGMVEQHKRLGKEKVEDIFSIEELNLRESTIINIDVFAECKNINAQGCRIEEFNNNGNMIKGFTSKVNNFHIWQNTIISKMTISREVGTLKLEDTSITNVLARSKVHIDQLIIENSIVENCFGFVPDTFENETYDGWRMIRLSASNAKKLDMRSESDYQMAKYLYRKEKKGDKFISWMFDFCAGYGYKPLRVVRATGLLALLNTILFTVMKVIQVLNTQPSILINMESICKVIATVWSYLLLSLAAFAGQAGFTLSDGPFFWLAVIEYLLGVVLFAVFVNALYARYKE